VVAHTIELDETDRACPSCGGPLRPPSDQFETSETIDLVEVVVCACGSCVETANRRSAWPAPAHSGLYQSLRLSSTRVRRDVAAIVALD
jgi:hypothetical protein